MARCDTPRPTFTESNDNVIGRWALWWAALGAVLAGGAAQSAEPPPCPPDCICLSQSQVLCNSGSLRGVPELLPSGVLQLSIARADLPVLRSDAFAGLRHLRRLALDACNLTRIRPFAFRGLPRLREISIQHAPLLTVHAFAFAGLQNLTSIVLSHNRIAQVEGYAFAGTTYLRLLALNNNPMRRVLANAFSGLGEVERISLPSGVRVVEPDAFAGLEGVGSLELAYMDLASLQAGTFRGLARVRTLALRDSDLGIVRSGAFDGLLRVDSLQICNNKIDAIEEFILPYNSSVREVRFTGNHMLESPAPGTVALEVEVVTVRGNHLPCECGARDALLGPLALSPDFAHENFCISPLRVRGRTLASARAPCREPGGRAGARAAAAPAERAPALHAVLAAFFHLARALL